MLLLSMKKYLSSASLFLCVGLTAFAMTTNIHTRASYAAPSAEIASKEFENKKDVAQDVTLIPHKALYSIKVTALRSGAQITNLYGEMFFELENDCDAWISDHRSNLFYEYTEGGSVNITTDFATYERHDGTSMNFNTRREHGGRLFEEFRGYTSAEPRKNNKNAPQVTAFYTIPDGLNFDLPEGTLFPMQHTKEIIQHAMAGEKFFNATIFDGSDDEGPQNVNTFITSETNPKNISQIASIEGVNETLLDNKHWTLRMAYFPQDQNEASAEYEMTLIAHENGVVSHVEIDYEKFSLEQKLIALEATPVKNCK